MKMQNILPVVVSILLIIAIAVIEKQSKTIAGITAAMPVGAALGLWIVYSSSQGDPSAVTTFTMGMLIGIVPSIAFIFTAWFVSRQGYPLWVMLLAGFAVWGLLLLVISGVRRLIAG